MSALLQKMLRAREVRIVAGSPRKHTFIARRPTPIEREEKFRGDTPARGILSLVIGWEDVIESDLIPGGDPHPLPFDQDACAEWLADRPDLFAAVVDGVVKAYEAYTKDLDDILGN